MTYGDIVALAFLTAGTASVVFALSGIVRYTMAAGDQNVITSAKNTILYGVTGLTVALVSAGAFWLTDRSFNPGGEVSDLPRDVFAWLLGGVVVILSSTLLLAAFLKWATRVVVWLVAIWLPAGERAEFREQTRAMLARAGDLARVGYLYDLITRGAAMGLRRRRAVHAEKWSGDTEKLEY